MYIDTVTSPVLSVPADEHFASLTKEHRQALVEFLLDVALPRQREVWRALPEGEEREALHQQIMMDFAGWATRHLLSPTLHRVMFLSQERLTDPGEVEFYRGVFHPRRRPA